MDSEARNWQFSPFQSMREQGDGELEERALDGANALKYGVPFLDASLGGIYRNEMIVLGARTGEGKTELATQIALTNALAGKRVLFFALEAEPKEIYRRLLYKRLASRYFADPKRDRAWASYHDWRYGRLDKAFSPYYADEKGRLDALDKLMIRYRGREPFTVEQFEKEMSWAKSAELVVVDHFHHFDLEPGPELEAHKRLAKLIRDLAYLYGVPVLLVAHMRKSDRKFMTPCPELDEFYGTSEITKNATTTITIGKGPRHEPPPGAGPEHDNCWTTFFRVAKLRTDGNRARYVAATPFNASQGIYLSDFALGDFEGGKFAALAASELPHWARGRATQPAFGPEKAIKLKIQNHAPRAFKDN